MNPALNILDKFTILIFSLTVLVDMFNGFFLINNIPIPISQGFKFFLFILMSIRLSQNKDFPFVILIFIIFQISPLAGLIKTGDVKTYFQDFIIAFKWFNLPLSFFYFKSIIQSSWRNELISYLKLMVFTSFLLIVFNQTLGILGFGTAFYYEGYANATGTKGLIYAGNELTILVLSIAFIMFNYFKYKKEHFKNIFVFGVFMFLAFTMTSKTVLGGIVIVFLIPYLTNIKLKIKTKWFRRLVQLLIVGLPIVIVGFYYGLKKSGFAENFQYSVRVNNADFWTVLLSNRNNFVIQGWDYFVNYLNPIEKFVGLGEGYYLEIAEDIAEIDFITILFSGGIMGLLLLLFIITYWFLNAVLLSKNRAFVFAQPILVFLVFICVAGNTAGHIFNSGIAGFYTALAIALMFYKTSLKDKQVKLQN